MYGRFVGGPFSPDPPYHFEDYLWRGLRRLCCRDVLIRFPVRQSFCPAWRPPPRIAGHFSGDRSSRVWRTHRLGACTNRTALLTLAIGTNSPREVGRLVGCLG